MGEARRASARPSLGFLARLISEGGADRTRPDGMGGTYTRERTKARSPVIPRGSRGMPRHSESKTARSGRPTPATAKQRAGTFLSAARARSGRSPWGTSSAASLRRSWCVGQRSSQGIGASAQNACRPGPLPAQLGQGERARDGGLGDHDKIDPTRQERGCLTEELAKEALGSVARDGVTEFACHRNPEPRRTIVRPGGDENDGARQRNARTRLLNAEKLAALANPAVLRKYVSRRVLQGAFARRSRRPRVSRVARRLGRRSYFL
jgi:hypothetical protein